MRSVFAIAALAASAAAIKLTQDFPTEGEVMDFAKEHGITEEDVAAAIAEYCPECETEDDVFAFLKENEKEIEKKIKEELELAQEDEMKPKGDKPEGDKPECSGAESGSDSDIPSGESDVESEEDLDIPELAQEGEDVDMEKVEKDVKIFIDELWYLADTNGDDTLDAEEGEAALTWAAEKGFVTEEEAIAIFEHIGEFAGEDEVVSKDEMFESAKAAAQEHPEEAEQLFADAKDAIFAAYFEQDVKFFIDELWKQADTNSDDTLDADEGETALTWAVGEEYLTVAEAEAIFAYVGEFAGEDGVVSKDEMFESAKSAYEEHPEEAEQLYRETKANIEAAEE